MAVMTRVQKVATEDVPEMVNENAAQLQTVGRKAVRAYAGLWGMSYDEATALFDRSKELFEKAEQRGEKMESRAADRVQKMVKQVGEQVDEVQNRIGQTLRRTGAQAEEQVEDRVERVLRQMDIPSRKYIVEMSNRIDALSRQIDEVILMKAPVVVEEPLPKYDTLTAKEVVQRLDGLTITELVAVKQYEMAHDNRVTVLREVDGRIEAMPIARYDELTVDEIEPLLGTLDAGQLTYVAEYEAAHEDRVTLLRAIEDELAARREAVA